MKIVSVFGKGNVGKSTTLKLFLARLLKEEKYNCKLVYPYDMKFDAESILQNVEAYLSAKRNKMPFRNYDICVVFEFNNRKIGLTTKGDDVKALERHFEIFKANRCEICFCAARTNEKMHEWLKNAAGGDAVILYEHTAVKTYNLKDAFFSEKTANENMVNLLMRELK